MTNSIFDSITRPTLLLDEDQARRNIQWMADKARSQGKRFRPHFKTHQSAQVGKWFRAAGVSTITVSSVSMADYFIRNGWKDITIAFPLNWREGDEINRLADHNHLELLVESSETVEFLQKHLRLLTDVWIKIDVGGHRTGLWWQDRPAIEDLVNKILSCDRLVLRGFLTHGGHSYHAASLDEIRRIYGEGVSALNSIDHWFEETRRAGFEISVGDTPGCKLAADLGEVDEIRPGNFVFYDATMLALGVCQPQEVAVALACPVVAKHCERMEVVIYGGAVHLSKDTLIQNGQQHYGLIALPEGKRWGLPLQDCFVSALSQEHGIVRLNAQVFDQVKVGELLCVIPVHSCLTVDVMGSYLTLTGEKIEVMPRLSS
jgi:D-serine deaminase-like pyridoxal phosphate-dependent protein